MWKVRVQNLNSKMTRLFICMLFASLGKFSWSKTKNRYKLKFWVDWFYNV